MLEKSARLWKKMPSGLSCITMMVQSSVLSYQFLRYGGSSLLSLPSFNSTFTGFDMNLFVESADPGSIGPM